MFCTENKQTRGGSRTPRSSMMELFVTMEVILYWQSSFSLDDGGIVELPLRLLFPSTKVEVSKPDLRRIYLDMAPD